MSRTCISAILHLRSGIININLTEISLVSIWNLKFLEFCIVLLTIPLSGYIMGGGGGGEGGGKKAKWEIYFQPSSLSLFLLD